MAITSGCCRSPPCVLSVLGEIAQGEVIDLLTLETWVSALPPTAVWMASWMSATLICQRAASARSTSKIKVRLPGNIEDAEVRDAGHVAHNAGDLVGLILENMQVAAIDLGRKLALDSADSLFHVVFDGLREAPDDAREISASSSSVHGGDQVVLVLVKDRPPLFLRLQTHEVFGVEKSRMVGAVIRTAGLAGAVGRFGKRAKQDSGLIGDARCFHWAGALLKRAAHPERAFIQMRQKLGADDAAEGKDRYARTRPTTPTPTVTRR